MRSVVEEFHGIQVADPDRWLESLEEPEVQAWIGQQSETTAKVLEQLPEREPIERRLTELWNYPRQSVPIHKGGRVFYFRNEGLQNQPILYVRDTEGAEPRTLLDPNTWSEDGTVAISAFGFNEVGTLLAYSLSVHGSDWQEVRIRDVQTGVDLGDVLRWVRFTTLSFTPDSKSLYYSRNPAPGTVPPGDEHYFQKLYRHRLGTPQSEDVLVYGRPEDKDLGCVGEVSRNGRWLLLSVWKGTDKNSELYFRRLGDGPSASFVPLATGFDASYSIIDAIDDTLYVLTDVQAPRKRIVAIDLNRPARANWKEIVPQGEDTLLRALVAGGALFVNTLHRASHRLFHYTLDGQQVGAIPLPGIGAIGSPYVTFPSLEGDPEQPNLYFCFTSFLHPHTNFRYHVATRKLEQTEASARLFDVDRFQTRQVFYESKDGTLISMFLVHKRGLVLDGENPVYLYGYGGFNINVTPDFKPGYPLWLELGGIVAIPNLRGGAEYGEAWHAAGMLGRKQNVFDDFIGAAEYLIESGYTRPEKIGIAGRSNGGLLTAACMVQKPDLFGAVLSGVPVIDMLRYHLFTVGRYWIPEYGCAEDPAQFSFLYAYSPLHNVRKGTHYPATLITTADTDDRVHPVHSFKFAARLQEGQGGTAPILLRVERKAGHGAGTPTDKSIAEAADVWAFLAHHLGTRA